MDDLISRQAAIDAISAIKDYGNSDRANALGLAECAVTTLPSAQPEQIARDIATIIENEQDMRVILNNEEHTETHSCVDNRTETHDSCTDCPLYDHDRHSCPRFNKVIPTTIRDAQQRWIPVTERLPEDACQCIVTAKVKHVDNYPDYEVDTADFADGVFTTANSWWGVESIIAWMPLPEPYKG